MLGKLIKANFRKDFSQMISFLLIVILSSTMLGCGLTLLLGYNDDYETKLAANNSAHVRMHVVGSKDHRDELTDIERYLASSPCVEDYVTVDGLMATTSIDQSDNDDDVKDLMESAEYTALFTPLDEDRDIERMNFIEKSDEEYDNPIYISGYVLRQQYQNRFKVGDEIVLSIGEHIYEFRLAGVYETLMAEECFYVTESQYADMVETLSADSKSKRYDAFILITTVDGITDDAAADEIMEDLGRRGYNADISTYTKSMMLSSDMIMVNVISAILCAFSLLISIVVLIIVFFRISNSIEQNIVNIGALKALGCTSSQIRKAHIMEFVITAVAASVAGIVAMYLLLPPLGVLVGTMTMMTWDAHMIPGVAVILPFLFGALTCVMASFSTAKIRDLDPVIALRFGLQNHSFKKNYLPLATSGGPLVGILALKSSLQSRKQNIMTLVIMGSVGLVTAFVIFFGYNICYKPINLYNILQSGSYDLMLAITDPDAYYEVSNVEHVRECYWRASEEMTVAGQAVDVTIVEDLGALDTINFTEGRAPLYSDEIVMSATAASQADVMIGDVVKVSYKGCDKELVVCGLAQGTDNLGKFALMNDDCARTLGYTARTNIICITLDRSDIATAGMVAKEIENMYGDKLTGYVNIPAALPETPIIIGSTAICILIVIVTVLVILLSMTLLIKTVIIRKQQEFGIKKSLGFTSSQLRKELVISMMPCVIIGSSIGAVIGTLKSNAFLTALLGSLGLAESRLPVYGWMGVAAVIFTTLISAVIIWMLSGKIKKISAYSLIKE